MGLPGRTCSAFWLLASSGFNYEKLSLRLQAPPFAFTLVREFAIRIYRRRSESAYWSGR